jgi:ribonuclease HI
MSSPKPHFLLFCDGNTPASGESAVSQRGRWRFVLEDVESGQRMEATDVETSCAPDRCALVSVLRGLESLEQPSRVTLITTSRYVTRGLQYGLTEWRDNDFSWEHFGAVQPIRNADIWRRIDRTLAFHQVQCRWMAQEESPQEEPTEGSTDSAMDEYEDPRTETRTVAVATKQKKNKTDSADRPVRSVVASANHQRVYVDTPKNTISPPQHGQKAAKSSTQSNPAPTANPESPSNEPASSHSVPESTSTPTTSRLRWVFYPIRFATAGCLQLGKSVWEAVLAIDEWLESFLRCLLLLEPKNRRSRQTLESTETVGTAGKSRSFETSDAATCNTPNQHHSV